MRTLSQEEIDQVGGGGLDQLKLGPATITGIEAGLALRNIMGAAGLAFGVGYAGGTYLNSLYTAHNGGVSLGTQFYHSSSDTA
jgi:hypothetical protein